MRMQQQLCIERLIRSTFSFTLTISKISEVSVADYYTRIPQPRESGDISYVGVCKHSKWLKERFGPVRKRFIINRGAMELDIVNNGILGGNVYI